MRAKDFIRRLTETTAGATASSGIAVAVSGPGVEQAQKALRKKQQSYSNVIKRGGPIKAKK